MLHWRCLTQLLFGLFPPCPNGVFYIPVHGCGILSLCCSWLWSQHHIGLRLSRGTCGCDQKCCDWWGSGQGLAPLRAPLGGDHFLLLPSQCVQMGPLSQRVLSRLSVSWPVLSISGLPQRKNSKRAPPPTCSPTLSRFGLPLIRPLLLCALKSLCLLLIHLDIVHSLILWKENFLKGENKKVSVIPNRKNSACPWWITGSRVCCPFLLGRHMQKCYTLCVCVCVCVCVRTCVNLSSTLLPSTWLSPSNLPWPVYCEQRWHPAILPSLFFLCQDSGPWIDNDLRHQGYGCDGLSCRQQLRSLRGRKPWRSGDSLHCLNLPVSSCWPAFLKCHCRFWEWNER